MSRRGSDEMGSDRHCVELRLRSIEDLFRKPEVSPMTEEWDVASYTSGIEFIAGELYSNPGARELDVTLLLPAEQIEPDLDARTRAGVERYCHSRMRELDHEIGAQR